MTDLIKAALREDIGPGDITTNSIVPHSSRATAILLAKQDLVCAGLDIVKEVFKSLDKGSVFVRKVREGRYVKKGTVLAKISGKARALLSGERVALNILQRMCAVATVSRRYAEKVKGTKAVILDTRKTTPLLREMEKYAVKTGGAANHRTGLFDSVLIKDNHIVVAGSIGSAIKKARSAGHKKIEAEATTLAQVSEALKSGADIILLDNMGVPLLKKAVKLVSSFNRSFSKKVKTEASGGITLDNVRSVARTGVDRISVGALTHSAGSADISLEFTGIDS